ncbi:MAG: hypothetical protein GX125_02710, partial [Bacteroidales bacterium]|nr:hypothetical protein [Bacteroidales bacterium]
MTSSLRSMSMTLAAAPAAHQHPALAQQGEQAVAPDDVAGLRKQHLELPAAAPRH